MAVQHDDLDAAADDWLIGKAQAGDVDAYEVLVRRHRNRIYRIALRMLANPHDAEDVAQDVVIQLWTALAGFTGEGAFTTWLYRIVQRRLMFGIAAYTVDQLNRCLNLVRRRPPVRPILDSDHPPTVGADDEVVARQRSEATLRAIGSMPPDLRAVFVLQQIEGLSYQEVATILDVPEATVRGRLYRARRHLLDTLRSWS